MSNAEIIRMMEILPNDDKELIYLLIKKLVLAWDPDFTKLTPKEAEELRKAEEELEKEEVVEFEKVDW